MNPVAVGKILKEVLKYGPLISEAARTIYDNTKDMFGKKPNDSDPKSTISIQELDNKIGQLEQNDVNQTKLLSDLAQQNDNLSKLTSALATRLLYAIIIASVCLISSIYIIIIL
ncbi:MAG: hypothetical protein HQ510_07790 [Candidatus Marinimicrobia bacterium]|nr:hypothetical protein [Candidatus Neomarinimicrobiota bacterium]